ncbi:hypothetical protein K469DRAFT_717161 [Zopfia rhizophila CBS 207.26]|uniref:Uncharacterized protein n=1 Tax=Zopfia rhizophila CBS 207.26 TaxID=1314779 RepID=A0A6A6EPA3_9PEZI|nr:hypothetical protein K469DRAFT_717161 [Zopfia rhizophila CBS 207.26]
MADRAQTQAPPTSKNVKHSTRWIVFLTEVILIIFTAPYRRTFKLYTWKPIREIRAADGDRTVLVAKIRDWKTDKYAELQSVQVAASFCTGATLATISWSTVPNPIWLADALWFSSLICSVWGIITSIQIKSILDDIPDKDQLNERLSELELKRTKRVILRYKKRPGVGHWIMLFLWQFPSMTMSYAWCTFLSGLTVYVCTPFIRRDEWGNHHKIAIMYLIVGSIGFCTYLFSTCFVFAGEKELQRSVNTTRINTNDMESGVDLLSTSKKPSDATNRRRSSEIVDPVENLQSGGLFDVTKGSRDGEESGNSKRQLLY